MSNTIQIIDTEVNLDTDYLHISFFGAVEITEFEKLSQLKNLKHLNLCSSDLYDQHLEIIGGVKTIELLDLGLTEITDKGLGELKSLKHLRELRLKDNPQLTDGCVKYLIGIDQLEFIHIENTSITILGLSRLLNQKDLKTVILGPEFDTEIDEVVMLTKKYLKLEITLKGI